jgi:hypothetical protein
MIALRLPALGSCFLSFAQHVVLVPGEGREQIADDPARSGLHLHRDSHARTEINDAIPGLQLPLVERYPGGVDEIVRPLLARPPTCSGHEAWAPPRRGRRARWYRARRSTPCHGGPHNA